LSHRDRLWRPFGGDEPIRKPIIIVATACLALAGGATLAADPPAGPPPEDRWSALDTDGDGRLSRAEAEAGAPGMARNFGRFDVDADGQVTREEIQAARVQMHEQARARAEQRWREADANGDGSIDRAEAEKGMPRAAENFGRLDADTDGLLSRDELQQAMRQRHAEWMQRAPGAGHGPGGPAPAAGKPPGGGRQQ
jgi:hypothetical protein